MLHYDEYDCPMLYLIDIRYGGIYIGWLQIPTTRSSLADYKNWEYGHTPGMISLNDTFAPQIIYHSSIKNIIAINDIAEEVAQAYNVKKEDFVTDSFKDLLMRLFQIKDLDFFNARTAIKEHYKVVFGVTTDPKKES